MSDLSKLTEEELENAYLESDGEQGERVEREMLRRDLKIPSFTPSAGFSPENPLPVDLLRTDGDRSRKYIMRCKNHPNLEYRSKDPHSSSIFASQPGTCDCTGDYLEVIGREK